MDAIERQLETEQRQREDDNERIEYLELKCSNLNFKNAELLREKNDKSQEILQLKTDIEN